MYDKNKYGQDRVAHPFCGRGAVSWTLATVMLLASNSFADVEAPDNGKVSEPAPVKMELESPKMVVATLDGVVAVESTDGNSTLSPNAIGTRSAVQFPRVVGEMVTGTDSSRSYAHSNDGQVSGTDISHDSSSQGMSEFGDKSGSVDQVLAPDFNDNLSVINGADMARRKVGGGGTQLTGASSGAGGNDSAGLPYAVLLALLALIGLVPVARRNDHHHGV